MVFDCLFGGSRGGRNQKKKKFSVRDLDGEQYGPGIVGQWKRRVSPQDELNDLWADPSSLSESSPLYDPSLLKVKSANKAEQKTSSSRKQTATLAKPDRNASTSIRTPTSKGSSDKKTKQARAVVKDIDVDGGVNNSDLVPAAAPANWRLYHRTAKSPTRQASRDEITKKKKR